MASSLPEDVSPEPPRDWQSTLVGHRHRLALWRSEEHAESPYRGRDSHLLSYYDSRVVYVAFALSSFISGLSHMRNQSKSESK